MAVHGLVLTYGGVASSAVAPNLVVQRAIRPGTGSIRDQYREPSGLAGSWFWQDERGDEEQEFVCSVFGTGISGTTRRLAQYLVWQWTNVPGRAELIVSDEPDRFRVARLAHPPMPAEIASLGKFSLVFRSSPYAYSVDVLTTSLTAASGSDPYNTTFGVATDADIPPVIEVTAVQELTGGFTLTINGRSLTYGETVSAGQTVTINSLSSVVLDGASDDVDLVGTFDENDVDMADVDGDFPFLQNGTNSLTLDRASGTGQATIVISWRRRYL